MSPQVAQTRKSPTALRALFIAQRERESQSKAVEEKYWPFIPGRVSLRCAGVHGKQEPSDQRMQRCIHCKQTVSLRCGVVDELEEFRE